MMHVFSGAFSSIRFQTPCFCTNFMALVLPPARLAITPRAEVVKIVSPGGLAGKKATSLFGALTINWHSIVNFFRQFVRIRRQDGARLDWPLFVVPRLPKAGEQH